MPFLKKCRHPGCFCLAVSGSDFCDKHQVRPAVLARPEKRELTASQRGYGSKWRKLRGWYIRAHPLCEECKRQGRITQATDVDHIVPHRGDQKLFWDRSNW